jgi:hypothetical protein
MARAKRSSAGHFPTRYRATLLGLAVGTREDLFALHWFFNLILFILNHLFIGLLRGGDSLVLCLFVMLHSWVEVEKLKEQVFFYVLYTIYTGVSSESFGLFSVREST